jgi:hypothetical protein
MTHSLLSKGGLVTEYSLEVRLLEEGGVNGNGNGTAFEDGSFPWQTVGNLRFDESAGIDDVIKQMAEDGEGLNRDDFKGLEAYAAVDLR